MVEKPMFAEIDYAERLVGEAMDEWSKTTSARVGIFWAIRRADPELLSWKQLGQLSVEDFDVLDDEVAAGPDADPPVPTPSAWPDGPVAAADSQPIDAVTTSST
jgi:hypothetical protein